MASTAKQIADQVLGQLQSGTFSKAIDPEIRVLPPRFKAEQLTGLKVLIVPGSLITEQANRAETQGDYGIDIGVMKLIVPKDVDECDGYLELVGEIGDYIKDKSRRVLTLADGSRASWVSNEQDPLYFPEHLEQYNSFVSVITATYRTIA